MQIVSIMQPSYPHNAIALVLAPDGAAVPQCLTRLVNLNRHAKSIRIEVL